MLIANSSLATKPHTFQFWDEEIGLNTREKGNA